MSMKATDEELKAGMIDALQSDFSAVPRGPMSPASVYAEYQAIKSRPSVPYVPPPKPAEIPQSEKVLTVEVKRVLVVISVATPCAVVVANGAMVAGIIANAVAPFVGVSIGLVGIGFLISSFRGSGKTGASEKQTHIHYHQYNQYNNSNNGQNNSI